VLVEDGNFLPQQQPLDETEEDLECQCRYLNRLRLLLPAEHARIRDPTWPGCMEENEAAWQHVALTAEDIRAWLEELVEAKAYMQEMRER